MKHLFTRFLAMALSAAMLFELLPAASAVTASAADVSEGQTDSRVVGEIKEGRTEIKKDYLHR